MASKRPSYVSIRARQRNILEGMEERGLNKKQAAKEFGVTRRQLETFIETKPKGVRTKFNRSPAYAKLYREGERKETRRVLGVKSIHRVEFRENIIRPFSKLTEPKAISKQQTGRMIQRLYYTNNIQSQQWAAYTRESGLPLNMDAIRLLHRNGKISDANYNAAVTNWGQMYGLSVARVAEYAED